MAYSVNTARKMRLASITFVTILSYIIQWKKKQNYSDNLKIDIVNKVLLIINYKQLYYVDVLLLYYK